MEQTRNHTKNSAKANQTKNPKKSNQLSFGRTRFWIITLLILLLILNAIAFYIYHQSHLSENLWTQLWEYSKSDTFKYLTISIILPIFLFLSESLFEIRKVIEDRAEAERQRARESRWHCIEQTTKMWNNLYNIITEVRYFKKKDKKEEGSKSEKNKTEAEPRKTTMNDILIKLENLQSSANDVINMWDFAFPILSDVMRTHNSDDDRNEDDEHKDDGHQDFFHSTLYLLDILNNSTFAIAHAIQDSDDPIKVKEWQDTLGTIQRVVKTIVHHPLLNILKNSAKVQEGGEYEDLARADIQKYLNSLKFASDLIRQEEIKTNKVLSHIIGTQGKNLRDALVEYKTWIKDHQSEEFINFKKLFYKIENKDLLHGGEHFYSLEWIKHLAKFLAFVEIYRELKTRAECRDIKHDNRRKADIYRSMNITQ